jgi:trigger factor
MELNIQVDKPSNILRKLTIRVPATVVAKRFEKGLAEVQRTARIKGFRPGQVPLGIIKQYYGEDVRHRVYHHLIDESFAQAVRDEKIKAIGRPQIESPEHQHGKGEHDHAISEDKDFTFTATVEILPEIEVKNYTGLSLSRENVDVTDKDVDAVVTNLQEQHAELLPASSGLAGADGKPTSRPVRKGDYADVTFHGGIVTDSGVQERADMKGSRVIEIGSNSLIEGFEDQIVDMRSGETKTFRIQFPADYQGAEVAGKEAEFTVTVNELKEKKLPEMNDEFAKQAGYEGVADLKTKAREFLLKERTRDVDQKLRSEAVQQLVEKTTFDVPQIMIESQTRALAQDWAEQMKQQGAGEDLIRDALVKELDQFRKRAESQVRASLVLEAIAAKENITVTDEDLQVELKTLATSMNVEAEKLREYYAKNPGRMEDLEFRLRQDRTLKFLLDKAKIKSKS